ncbi:MAG: hypothetical protein OHK0028_09510 [Deltaproteobacteria bacterium]
MDCTQTRDRLSDYQDGALDAAAAEALSAHLRGCGECAAVLESLAAVRERLRTLPPLPAPPELAARVLASVAAESAGAAGPSGSGPPAPPKSFLSRFRLPLEAAAAVLLAASLYWYQRATPPAAPPATAIPSDPSSGTPGRSAAGGRPAGEKPAGSSRTRSASPVPAGEGAPAAGRPGKTAGAFPGAAAGKKERSPAPAVTGTARIWNPGDLPAAPAIRASSDSERIVPAPPPEEHAAKERPAAGSPALEGTPRAEPAERVDPPWPRVFAAPPSRLFRPLPYGREIVLNVAPEDRAGAEDRIAAAASRLGGIVERIERESGPGDRGATGTVRVILPAAAAGGFLEELRRMGTVPPGGMPAAIDIPAGPRPGTVAYAVRIRVP